MSTKKLDIRFALFTIAAGAISILLGVLLQKCNSTEAQIDQIVKSDTIRVSDTIVIRDTIRIKTPKPQYAERTRIDTVTLTTIEKDTVFVEVLIERKIYSGEYYKATIEGYKPNLISMDIYNKTITIRDTTFINNTYTKLKRPRWVVSVGPGIGYGPKGVEPYIGFNVGFMLWSK